MLDVARDSTVEDAAAFADLTVGVRWLDTTLVFSGEALWTSRWGESDSVRSLFNDHSPTLDFSFKTNRGLDVEFGGVRKFNSRRPAPIWAILSTPEVEKAGFEVGFNIKHGKNLHL